MITLKIIQSLISLVFIFVIVGITINFIKTTRRYNKRMRNLKQWSQFQKQLIEWGKEISDPIVRLRFMSQHVHKLIQKSNKYLPEDYDDNGLDNLDNLDIEEEKQKICDEWGKYIPSLVQHIRENKLNQIL